MLAFTTVDPRILLHAIAQHPELISVDAKTVAQHGAFGAAAIDVVEDDGAGAIMI